jgi:hypothetical protein
MSAPSSSSASLDPLAELAQLRQQVQQLYHMQNSAASNAAAIASSVAAAAPSHSSLPKIRQPSAFRGEMGFLVDEWISEMEQQFLYYTNKFPDDSSRIKFATVHLVGNALQWWNHEPGREALLAGSWANFVVCLRTRFRPVKAELIARQRLDQLRQRSGQGANQYANLFQTTLNPITDMSPADQVHKFTKGLLPHLAAKVFEKAPVDLKTAIEWAVRLEANGIYGRTAALPAHAYGRGNYSANGNGAASSSTGDAMDESLNNIGMDGVDQSDPDQESPSNPAAASGAMNAEQVQSIFSKFESLLDQRLNSLVSGRYSAQQKTVAFSKGNGSGGGRGKDRVPGLTPADVARLRSENRCFRCKKVGHMKSDCPNPVNNRLN